MEYLRYWSLRHPAFAAAPSFFFASTERRMILAGVESLVTRNIPFGVIAGPSGCGTTTLLKFLATSSGFGDSAAEVIFSSGRLFDRLRPINVLAKRLGLPRSDSSEAMVANTLQAAADQGVHTVWLIDDCSAADAVRLPEITNAWQRLTIIVAGQQELATTLNVGRAMVVKPLRLQETREYIQQSLATAGRSTNPFDESAIKAIHQCSGGRIKRMGELAEQAMELAYRLGLRQIRARHIGQLTHGRRAA